MEQKSETELAELLITNVFLKLDGTNKTSQKVKGAEAKEMYSKCASSIKIVDNEKLLIVKSNGVPNYTPTIAGKEIIDAWNDDLLNSSDENPNSIGEQNYEFSIPNIDITKDHAKIINVN